ncbi:MAG: restriction endonuclease subunit S [Rickettsiaceae bacterium]|nr:restriction endonuclease subunit S [Rickettsiaceae bacterium]
MSNWEMVSFGSIAEFKNGLNFKSGKTGYELKILRVVDFQDRTTFDQVDKFSTIHTKKEINSSYHLHDGDLVFVRSNGNKALVGRCMLVHCRGEKISFSGFTIRARFTSEQVKPEFINLLMQGELLKKVLKKDSRGTNISNLNQNILSKLRFPLPSIIEQTKLLKFFSNWDIAIEKTEVLIDAKEHQFEWLKSKLLKSVIEEYQNSKKFLPDICKIRTGKKDVNQGNPEGNYPFFTCAKDHTFSDSYSYDMEAILLAGNGYIGNPILYRGKFEAYQRTYILHDFTDVDAKYLNYFLKRSLQKKIVQEKQEGAMSYIKLGTLQSIEITVPPIKEQKRIAETLNTAQEEINLLKKLADQYRTQKRGLMQKLLSGQWHVKNKEVV